MRKSLDNLLSGWISPSRQEVTRKYLLPTAFVLAFVLLVQVSNSPQAQSVSRGNIEIGSKFVVSLVNYGEQSSACSGSLITSDIVVTAAHCVYRTGYIAEPSRLSVTFPGSVVNSSVKLRLFQVEKITPVPTFGSFTNTQNQYSVDVDDIAFLFLKEPVPNFESVQIANSGLVTRMKNEELEIKHYGYGLQKQNPYTLDGNPYSVILKATNNPVSGKSPSANDKRVIYSKGTIPGPATCSGDSGGPGYVTESGITYLVSVISGAGGCDSSTYLAHTFSTLIFPHLEFLESEYRLYIEEKAAAELRTKLEAEAKAAAELKAKQDAAAKAAALKKTTIVCVKGKLSKKITAIKPKCPAGYKKK